LHNSSQKYKHFGSLLGGILLMETRVYLEDLVEMLFTETTKFFLVDGVLHSMDNSVSDTGVMFRVTDLMNVNCDSIQSKMLRKKSIDDTQIVLLSSNKQIILNHLFREIENL
jgi:hypothetical protein